MDRLDQIFEKQKELIERFHKIEEENEVLQTSDMPVNLDNRMGQARIKDMAWRFTEETAEAIDVYLFPLKPHDCDLFEELIDGLHFLTELTITAGINPDELVPEIEGSDKLETLWMAGQKRMIQNEYFNEFDTTFEVIYTRMIMWLGMTCNALRNKPWKQREVVTDRHLFQIRLKEVWIYYFALMVNAEMNPKDISQGYMGKNKKNNQRIDEGQ